MNTKSAYLSWPLASAEGQHRTAGTVPATVCGRIIAPGTKLPSDCWVIRSEQRLADQSWLETQARAEDFSRKYSSIATGVARDTPHEARLRRAEAAIVRLREDDHEGGRLDIPRLRRAAREFAKTQETVEEVVQSLRTVLGEEASARQAVRAATTAVRAHQRLKPKHPQTGELLGYIRRREALATDLQAAAGQLQALEDRWSHD